MLEAYSLSVDAVGDSAIPFRNVTIQKGCTATQNGDSTFVLNKCGVYMVSCNASAADAVTIQLYKDGVAQPQAQSTGTSPAFTTLIQVSHNNCDCPCSSPTNIQIINIGDAATYDDVNIVITKVV